MKKYILITVMLVLMLLAAACAPETPVSVDGNASFTTEVTQTPTAPIHDSTPGPTPTVVVTATPVITPTPTVKPTPTPQPVKTYKQAYAEVVRQYAQEHGEDATYDLIDFNGDEIPELAAGRGCVVSLFTYANGEVVCLMDEWGFGAFGNMGYEYLPGKNIMRNENSDYAGWMRHTSYYTLKDNKLVSLYGSSLRIDFWEDVDGDSMFSEEIDKEAEEPLYYLGDRRITKAEYDSYEIEETGFIWIYELKTKEQILKELE